MREFFYLNKIVRYWSLPRWKNGANTEFGVDPTMLKTLADCYV